MKTQARGMESRDLRRAMFAFIISLWPNPEDLKGHEGDYFLRRV